MKVRLGKTGKPASEGKELLMNQTEMDLGASGATITR